MQFVNILFPCFISPPNAKCSTDCCNVSVFALRFKILDIRMCIHLSRNNVVVHLFTEVHWIISVASNEICLTVV